MMALPLRVLRYKSVMQCETRSLRAGQGRHELLEAPNLDACFEQVQNKRRGVALWESDNDAVQSICQREGNYLSVLRTNQKRMEAILGPRIFPRDRMCNSCTIIVLSIRAFILFIVPLSRFHSHVTGMYNSCTLIVLSIGVSILFIAHAIIALPLRFVGLFALFLRPHCAATETVALMIHFKVLFRCFQLLHNACMLRFHFRLTFCTPLHCSCQSADPLRLF